MTSSIIIVLLFILSNNILCVENSGESIENSVNFFATSRKTDRSQIFNGLNKSLYLNFMNAEDVQFFNKHYGYEQLFAVSSNSSEITVYHFLNDVLTPITSHPIAEVYKIHIIEIQESLILIIEGLRYSAISTLFLKDGKFIIQDENQKFDVTHIKHLSIYQEESKLIICLSSSNKIYVYSWWNHSLKLLQVLPLEADFSFLFKFKEAFVMVTSGKERTVILKYQSEMQRFITIQNIKRSFFYGINIELVNPSIKRQFLILLESEKTIIYKWLESIFIPYQNIDAANKVVPITYNNRIILFLLKNGNLNVYQYNFSDNRRFEKLNFELSGIKQIKLLILNNEKQLLVKDANGYWSINRISWKGTDTTSDLLEEMKLWSSSVKERVKSITEPISSISIVVKIFKVQMSKVKVKSINGISIQEVQNSVFRYNKLTSHLKVLNESENQGLSLSGFNFTKLWAGTVKITCRKSCKAINLITKMKCDPQSFRKVNNIGGFLEFESVKVNYISGFPCPVVGVQLNEIMVRGLMNGVLFDSLQKNILRKSGSQVVAEMHVFDELHVYSVHARNVEVASFHTRQVVKTEAIYAKEFNLANNDRLLPLDGKPVVVTGTLTVSKAKFKGLIRQRGGLKGKGVKRLASTTYFQGNHTLYGNYSLSNLRVVELLSIEDIVREQGISLKEIADKAVSLENKMPVHLALQENITVWENITVENLPNWLTRKNSRMVIVAGTKIAVKNIILSDISKLPIPKIRTYVCSISAITTNIKTSTLLVDQARVKFIVSGKIYGAEMLENIILGFAFSLPRIDFSQKNFTGNVHVENLDITDFENSPFRSFNEKIFRWYQPDLIQGSIKVDNFKAHSITSNGIKIFLPSFIQSLLIKGNFQVDTVNSIKFEEFLQNSITTNSSVRFQNIIFMGRLEVDDIEVINTNIDLSSLEENVHLGNKTIAGILEIEDEFSIPSIFLQFLSNEISKYTVEGSIEFKKEPLVENINNKNIPQLIPKIWMGARLVSLTRNFYIKKVTLTKFSNFFESLETSKFGYWKSLEDHILSKTGLQAIQVSAILRKAQFPNIITRKNSTLYSSNPHLSDLFYKSLKKNGEQIIQDKWRLNELVVLNNLQLFGNLNGLNLTTDVARHDVKLNDVNGEKIVGGLIVDNLFGLMFGNWTKDTLLQSNSRERIIIKGKKTFHLLRIKNMQVDGTVMGKRLENCLLKIGQQIITAPKVLKGSPYFSNLIVDRSVNDINITELAEADTVFLENLQIFGNLTIYETFQDIKIVDYRGQMNEIYKPIVKMIMYLKSFTTEIKATIENRARYWNGFQDIETVISPSKSLMPIIISPIYFYNLGDCILISIENVECNDKNTFFIKTLANTADILVNKMLSVENIPLVVQVTSGTRSRIMIHQYNYITNTFELSENIRTTEIMQAAVASLNGVVWIAVRLESAMLLVRYESWGSLLKYYLPKSQILLLDLVPTTRELVLVRDDGIWKLEGLARPRRVVEIVLVADEVDSFTIGNDFFVKLIYKINGTRFFKATYVGI